MSQGGRAIIVGHAPSAGMYGEVGRGQYKMPGDLSLQFPTGRPETLDGQLLIEGVGVVPDILVPVTYDSVMGSTDAVLQAAVQALLDRLGDSPPADAVSRRMPWSPMTDTADVIIIGGGIHGASLAFHLTRRGLRPLVLERRFVAAGATGRSSGLVRMHYDLEPESALAWASYQMFRSLDRDRRRGVRFHPHRVPADRGAGPRRSNCEPTSPCISGLGIPSLVVTADDVHRLAPAFYIDDFDHGGL